MPTIFKTGHKNAGQMFVYGKTHVQADEFGLVTIDDPETEASWAKIFQVYDPANPDKTDAVAFLKEQKRKKEEVLVRLEVPEEPVVPAPEEKKSKGKGKTNDKPVVEQKVDAQQTDPQQDAATTEDVATKTGGKPWLQKAADLIKGE